jgi:hypothetical protein
MYNTELAYNVYINLYRSKFYIFLLDNLTRFNLDFWEYQVTLWRAVFL